MDVPGLGIGGGPRVRFIGELIFVTVVAGEGVDAALDIDCVVEIIAGGSLGSNP